MLRLKANQPQAHDAVETFFAEAIHEKWRDVVHQTMVTEDADHGRVERRQYWTTTDPDLLAYLHVDNTWAELTCVGMVERTRTHDGTTSCETSYYLSSLDGTVATFARAVRGHWGIENTQHWVLDIAFREDECRVRTGYAAENFAVLRRMALNLLQHDTTTKGGVKARRLKAGWDDEFLLQLLSQ